MVEGRVVIAEAEVAVPQTPGRPHLVVVLLQVARAELLQRPEYGLLLPPQPPERLDTEEARELEQDGEV